MTSVWVIYPIYGPRPNDEEKNKANEYHKHVVEALINAGIEECNLFTKLFIPDVSFHTRLTIQDIDDIVAGGRQYIVLNTNVDPEIKDSDILFAFDLFYKVLYRYGISNDREFFDIEWDKYYSNYLLHKLNSINKFHQTSFIFDINSHLFVK